MIKIDLRITKRILWAKSIKSMYSRGLKYSRKEKNRSGANVKMVAIPRRIVFGALVFVAR